MIKVRFTNRALGPRLTLYIIAVRQRLKLESFAGLSLVGPVAQLGHFLVSKEQRSLKERQAHSQSRERPDGRRFESGRAHQEYRRELIYVV